jgi:hypothetical protein
MEKSMTPLNIASADVSSALLDALVATGCFVTQYELSLYVDGHRPASRPGAD